MNDSNSKSVRDMHFKVIFEKGKWERATSIKMDLHKWRKTDFAQVMMTALLDIVHENCHNYDEEFQPEVFSECLTLMVAHIGLRLMSHKEDYEQMKDWGHTDSLVRSLKMMQWLVSEDPSQMLDILQQTLWKPIDIKTAQEEKDEDQRNTPDKIHDYFK